MASVLNEGAAVATPRVSCGEEPPARLIDRFAPDAAVRERHEILIRAPADLVLEVAESFDLMSIPSVRRIFWLRAKMLRAPPPDASEPVPLLEGTRRMGWRELARRRGREVVVGAATQPWLPEPVFDPVAPGDFLAYDEPGRVKIAWTLEAVPRARGLTLFRTETRVVPTDQVARRKFARYWRLARAGIVLIRRFLLPAVRREAERRVAEAASRPLDRVLPRFDVALVRETTVEAPADATYTAVRNANLLDPIVRALFAVRELPERARAWARAGRPDPAPRSVTVSDFVGPETGMTLLLDEPGRVLVIGSVGRFWRRDYGHRHVSADGFRSFDEPGYAKLAMAFEVRPLDEGRSALRYEARTATTSEEARRRFGRYWMLIRPGVGLVMRRAVSLIRKEAEQSAGASAGVDH